MSEFFIQRVLEDGALVLTVAGYMGNEQWDSLEKELALLQQEKHRRLVLDCSALTFVTAASLARLSAFAGSLHPRHLELKVAGLSDSAQRIAQAAGFDRKLKIYPDVEAALNPRRSGKQESVDQA